MGKAMGRIRVWWLLLETAYGSRAGLCLGALVVPVSIASAFWVAHSSAQNRLAWFLVYNFCLVSSTLLFASKIVAAGAIARQVLGRSITTRHERLYRNLLLGNRALWILYYAVAAYGVAYGFRYSPSVTSRIFYALGVLVIFDELKKQGLDFLKTASPSRRENLSLAGALPILSKCAECLGLFFTPKFREQVYNPIVEEDKADLILALQKYQSRAGRVGVFLCFLSRFCFRILQLVAVSGLPKIISWVWPFVVKAKRD
jgi:hypothetical protein